MSGAWFRARSRLAHPGEWLVVAFLVAAVATAAASAAIGARRTATAYDRFLAEHRADDVRVVVPGAVNDPSFLDRLAALPQVADSARLAYVFLVPLGPDGKPNEYGGDALVSVDGRWLRTIDAVKVLHGRHPNPDRADEVAVSFDLAKQAKLHVGSTIVADSYSPAQAAAVLSGGTVEPGGPTLRLHVVGVEVAPGEVPPVAHTATMHLTPAFAREYGDRIALGPNLAVRLRHGAADVGAFTAAVQDLAGGRVLFANQHENAGEVRRSIQLQAVALAAFAGLAALAGIVLIGQALSRRAAAADDDLATLAALGMTPRQLVGAAVLETLPTATTAAVLAVVAAVALSGLMPFGSARLAEPHPGVAVHAVGLAMCVVAVLLVVPGLAALATWRASRRPADEESVLRPALVADRLARAGFPPSAVTGVRLATQSGRGAAAAPVRTAMGGVAVAIGAVAVALTYVASLNHLEATPRLFGWGWDAMVGNPYGSDLRSFAVPTLQHDPNVQSFSPATFVRLTIGGVSVPTLTIGGSAEVGPPVVTGRAPSGPGEVALGARTLEQLHAHVGDVVRVAGSGSVVPMKVVGRVVFPELGLEGAQGLGRGAVVTSDALARAGLESPYNLFLVRFVHPGPAALRAVTARFGDVAQLNAQGATRPSDVANFGRVRAMPFILSGVIALWAAAAVAHSVLVSARRRRRDLAILKSLGFVRRQVSAAVAWQATTLVVAGLIVGLPVGVAVGRWAWTVLAGRLGIVNEPLVPSLRVLVSVPIAVLVVNAAAAVPGVIAARTPAAALLRAE